MISIYTEMTPNPETMKFVANKLLYPGKSIDMVDEAAAGPSPLAQELFTFPFITPEAVWPDDARTLVLVNDNNFPGGGGRGPAGSKDGSEFIRLTLPQPLPR